MHRGNRQGQTGREGRLAVGSGKGGQSMHGAFVMMLETLEKGGDDVWRLGAQPFEAAIHSGVQLEHLIMSTPGGLGAAFVNIAGVVMADGGDAAAILTRRPSMVTLSRCCQKGLAWNELAWTFTRFLVRLQRSQAATAVLRLPLLAALLLALISLAASGLHLPSSSCMVRILLD